MFLFQAQHFLMAALSGRRKLEFMRKNVIKKITAVAAGLVLMGSVFALDSGMTAFQDGLTAYGRGEWESAVFLLKKAAGYPENFNADTYYMLITSEVYAGDNSEALDDCDIFLENFSDSLLKPRVDYLKGRILYNLGDYEKSIMVLSDFCHEYDSDEMYSYALFYIGESLYAGYKYDEASSIYERVVTDFPEAPKVTAAQYRLDSISQRSREEKLLYLLKQTGEEYLFAKEEYEKQLRMYNSENVASTKQKLLDAQRKNQELEQRILELEEQMTELQSEYNTKKHEYETALAEAKEKKPLEKALEKTEKKENDITVQQLKLKAELIKSMMKEQSE